MRTFYMFHEYPDLLMSRSLWGLQILMERKFFCYYVFFAWPLLLLFVPGLIVAARTPGLRVVFFAILLLFAGLTIQLWPAHGHYAAPGAGALLLIQLHALRWLRNARKATWLPWFTRSIVFALFLWMLVPISERLWNPFAFDNLGTFELPKEMDRARLQAQLSRLPGQHLILVHYSARDVPSKEWVYNQADIDHSKIVWARDMGPLANHELLHYYAGRHIWYVDRSKGALLMPYDTALSLEHPANSLSPSPR